MIMFIYAKYLFVRQVLAVEDLMTIASFSPSFSRATILYGSAQ